LGEPLGRGEEEGREGLSTMGMLAARSLKVGRRRRRRRRIKRRGIDEAMVGW
jgi:hypothetical protein